MIDVDKARVAAHQSNLVRYRRILTSPLTAPERDFVKRRMAEERTQLERLEQHGAADRSTASAFQR